MMYDPSTALFAAMALLIPTYEWP